MRVNGPAKRGTNLLFRAASPAFVEARVLDLDGKVVAGAVAPNSRAGGTLCPPVPTVLARGANIVQDSELRVFSARLRSMFGIVNRPRGSVRCGHILQAGRPFHRRRHIQNCG